MLADCPDCLNQWAESEVCFFYVHIGVKITAVSFNSISFNFLVFTVKFTHGFVFRL